MFFSYWECLIIIAVIIVMVIPGFLIRKKKMVSKDSIAPLSAVLLYVCQPFIIIKAFCIHEIDLSLELAKDMLLMFFLSLMIYLILFGLAKLTFIKQKKSIAGACVLCSLFSNATFMGIVFVELVTKSPLATLYAAVFVCTFNIMIWTLGVYLLTNDIKMIKPLKVLLNPSILVLFIALPMFFFPNINVIKDVRMVTEAVKLFAYACLPISMTIAGIRLADLSLKSIFGNWLIYLVAVFKLLIAPLVSIFLLLPLLVYDVNIISNEYIIIVIIIMMSLPPAAASIAITEQFHGEVDITVDGFILSTILSVISVPLVLLAFKPIIEYFG